MIKPNDYMTFVTVATSGLVSNTRDGEIVLSLGSFQFSVRISPGYSIRWNRQGFVAILGWIHSLMVDAFELKSVQVPSFTVYQDPVVQGLLEVQSLFLRCCRDHPGQQQKAENQGSQIGSKKP